MAREHNLDEPGGTIFYPPTSEISEVKLGPTRIAMLKKAHTHINRTSSPKVITAQRVNKGKQKTEDTTYNAPKA